MINRAAHLLPGAMSRVGVGFALHETFPGSKCDTHLYINIPLIKAQDAMERWKSGCALEEIDELIQPVNLI